MTTSLNKSIKKLGFLTVLLFCSIGYSQSFLISYPSAPENASACNNATLLTVRMNVTQASSSGATVTIDLADGMEYEVGSVIKTGGTAALTISENGGTSNQPQFTLGPTNLAVGNFIEFTILRRAVCEAYDNVLLGNVFKDRVIGDIGGVQTDEESIPYTINYPSLTFIQPPTINNALIGETRSRNFSITNGADGCANAVHFSIDYNGGGITPQSLTLGASTITPTSVVGSTYHYTINGALLTADGQLCNGETLVFTETVMINECNPTTDYNIGWGCAADPAAWCTSISGTGTVNMATGTPEFRSNRNTKIGYVDMCTPFQVETEFENSGSGHSAAATMYNIELRKGRGSGNINLIALNSKYSFANVTLNAQNVPWTFAGGILTVSLEDYFTADPDGAGVGLDDIDGDGFYDDLPKDSKVEILMDASIDCSRTCAQNTVMDNFAGAINYTTMCSSTVNRTNRIYAAGSNLAFTRSSFVTNGYVPPNIENNIPFRTRLSVGYYRWLDDFDGSDTRWVYDLTLPPGVSVAGTGNVVWQRGEYPAASGAPVATTYTQVGNVVTVTSPDATIGYASIDLVYDCSSGSGISLDYNFRKINNIVTGCECQDEFACGSLSANASCPGGCAQGPSSEIPIVRRADNSLGWTNSSMTTKQVASNISAYDLSKAIYLDEIEVHGDATQNGNSNTLGARLTLPKVNATTNKLTPLEIEVTITRGVSTIGSGTLTSFSMANSTGTDQIIDWDLDSLIPVGGLQSGDEIKTISRYQVTSNSMTQHDVQSGGQWFFYNTDPMDSSLIYCNFFTPEMYLVGTRRLIGTNSYRTYGCTINSLGGSTNYLARRFDASGFNYNSEYRPVMYVESIEAIIPDGYEFIQASISGGGVITPDNISGNTYTFNNPGTWPGVGLTVTNSYGRLYPFQVRATCDTEASEQIRFNFQIKDYYYHYAENDPTNTDYDTTVSNIRNIAHFDHPEINLDNQTGNIQASQPIESWVVRMSNPTNETAPYNWISIDDVSNVQIERVVDIGTGLEIPPTSYPGGNLYQLGTTGINSGQFKDYRIEFSYTSCLETTVKVYGGWNCGAYPTDPNLDTCSKEELDLIFTPAGGEVEIISVQEPTTAIDICTPLDYVFHINSAQSGNIIDNDFTILAPDGMNPVTGSFEAEYPVGSGSWEAIALNSNVGSSYNYLLTGHSNYPTNGLPGTLNDGGDANSRLMAVRFQMTSDCDFVAGSNFQVSAAANNICGTPAVGSSLESQTVSTDVSGVAADYSVVSTLNLQGSSYAICGSQVTLEATETIVSSSAIGPNGSIEIELPQGYLYTSGSFTCTSANCLTFDSVFTNVNGREVILLLLPAGLDNTDMVSYTYSINKNPNVYTPCGITSINVLAKDETTNIACASEHSGFCPIISVQTGLLNFTFETRVNTVITNRRITHRVKKN